MCLAWTPTNLHILSIPPPRRECLDYVFAYSPDGEHLVCGTSTGAILVFSTATQEQTSLIQRHALPVRSLGISPNSQTIYSASDDGTVGVSDIKGGRGQLQFRGPSRHRHILGCFPEWQAPCHGLGGQEVQDMGRSHFRVFEHV